MQETPRSRPGLRWTLLWPVLAALTLLACDGCRSHAVDDQTADSRVASGAATSCRPSTPRVLASGGSGPVALTAADDGFAVVFDRATNAEAGLYYVELGPRFEVGADSELLVPTAGPLRAESVVRADGAAAAVGRATGGRRAYLFSRTGPDPFTLVETPGLGGLDRRIEVALLRPEAGGGVQVVTHLSGTGEVGVGRLAGNLLVTRNLRVPTLLAPPAAAPTPGGGIALATVERLDDGQRRVQLREVGPDATAGRELVVAELPADRRAEEVAITYADGLYQLAWTERSGADATLERASIDVDTLALTSRDTVRVEDADATLGAFALAAGAGHTWLAWIEARPAGDTVELRREGAAGTQPQRLRLYERWGGRLVNLALDATNHGAALAWRELAEGESVGDVLAMTVDCR